MRIVVLNIVPAVYHHHRATAHCGSGGEIRPVGAAQSSQLVPFRHHVGAEWERAARQAVTFHGVQVKHVHRNLPLTSR